jgi:hypothetical protein
MSIDLEVQKEIAKVGMTVSMGITVATAFKMKSRKVKNLHVGAGVALIGFSLWHHLLYGTRKRSEKKDETIEMEKTL